MSSTEVVTRPAWIIFVIPHQASHVPSYARVFWNEALFRVRADEMRETIHATRSFALLYRVDVPSEMSDEGLAEWVEDNFIETERPDYEPMETIS